jgi:hypothetical protein
MNYSRLNPYGNYIIGTPGSADSIPKDKVAIIVPKWNTPGKSDATGAFYLEARAFCKRWNISEDRIYKVDNRLAKSPTRRHGMADDLLRVMKEARNDIGQPVLIWVFFCHGYTHGIQFSIRSRGHRGFNTAYEEKYLKFLDIISEHPAPAVILYACSTGDDPDGDPDTAPGSGDGSFADTLRDDLCKNGNIFCRVLSHTTAGHTTHNPFIKIYDGNGSNTGGVGGQLLADPETKQFKKLRRLLRKKFRFEAPFLSLETINKKIGK